MAQPGRCELLVAGSVPKEVSVRIFKAQRWSCSWHIFKWKHMGSSRVDCRADPPNWKGFNLSFRIPEAAKKMWLLWESKYVSKEVQLRNVRYTNEIAESKNSRVKEYLVYMYFTFLKLWAPARAVVLVWALIKTLVTFRYTCWTCCLKGILIMAHYNRNMFFIGPWWQYQRGTAMAEKKHLSPLGLVGSTPTNRKHEARCCCTRWEVAIFRCLSLLGCPVGSAGIKRLGSVGVLTQYTPHLYVGEITHLLYHLLTIDPNFQLDMLLCEMNCLLSPRFGSFSTSPMDQQETHRRLIIHNPLI